MKRHPLTHEPFWKFIIRKVGVSVSDSAVLSEERPRIDRHWQEFLELMELQSDVVVAVLAWRAPARAMPAAWSMLFASR